MSRPRDYLREQQSRDALIARERTENERALATAGSEGKNVTFMAEDGCEVTVTPSGHIFHNMLIRLTHTGDEAY